MKRLVRRIKKLLKDASKPRIAHVEIEGLITNTRKDAGPMALSMPVTPGQEVYNKLKTLAEDDRVRGVILLIRSPGGVPTGADIISEGIDLVRATGKPVWAQAEGLAASAALWIGVSCERFFSDQSALIGSIGVLGPALLQYTGPVTEYGAGILGESVKAEGIDRRIIFRGNGKTLGDPFSEPDEGAVASLERAIKVNYDIFVSHVAVKRDIDPGVIRQNLGAHIFAASGAQKEGLIDGVQSRITTLRKLASEIGFKEDEYKPTFISFQKKTPMSRLIGATYSAQSPASLIPHTTLMSVAPIWYISPTAVQL